MIASKNYKQKKHELGQKKNNFISLNAENPREIRGSLLLLSSKYSRLVTVNQTEITTCKEIK